MLTDREILDRIDLVVRRGGDVRVEAVDPLNPGCGTQAVVTSDVGLKRPTVARRGGDTGRDALSAALELIK